MGSRLLLACVSGVGLLICEADVEEIENPDVKDGLLTVWQFRLTDQKDQKLDYPQISGLMFTLSEILGTRTVRPF